MKDSEFDKALIASAFDVAAQHGWRGLSVGEAARSAGLPLAMARTRFPGRSVILLRFGRLLDEAALETVPAEGPVKDRLFDLLMRRFDVMQAHRRGVLALLHALPSEPGTALLLALATRGSMKWMLDAAGIDTSGLNGELHTRGLVAVWLWAVRAWRADESADLSTTMAALDTALERAGQASQWLPSVVRVGAAKAPAAPEPALHSGQDIVAEMPSVPPDVPPAPPPPSPPVV